MNTVPTDEHGSFAILEVKHCKDPLKQLGRKLVYVFHNLHIYHLEISHLSDHMYTCFQFSCTVPESIKAVVNDVKLCCREFLAEFSQWYVLQRICTQRGAGKFTVNIYVTRPCCYVTIPAFFTFIINILFTFVSFSSKVLSKNPDF